MREEFLYWYPLDLRVSGKDLMKNHLPFCLFQHVEILGSHMAPRNFRINGYVTIDGEKMSKSAGNFITLEDAFAKFGVDATRFALAYAGDDAIMDANFETSTAVSIREKLEQKLEWTRKIASAMAIIDPREERARLIPAAPLSWSSEAVAAHRKLRHALISQVSWDEIMEILFTGTSIIVCNNELIFYWFQMANVICSLKYYISNQEDWNKLFMELEKRTQRSIDLLGGSTTSLTRVCESTSLLTQTRLSTSGNPNFNMESFRNIAESSIQKYCEPQAQVVCESRDHFTAFFENRIKHCLFKTKEAYENMRLKDACHWVFFELEKYRKHYENIAPIMDYNVLQMYMEQQAIALAPLMPSFAQQVWQAAGHSDSVLSQVFPESTVEQRDTRLAEFYDYIWQSLNYQISGKPSADTLKITLTRDYPEWMYNIGDFLSKSDMTTVESKRSVMKSVALIVNQQKIDKKVRKSVMESVKKAVQDNDLTEFSTNYKPNLDFANVILQLMAQRLKIKLIVNIVETNDELIPTKAKIE
jgi:leucyl-tRNA synthetase